MASCNDSTYTQGGDLMHHSFNRLRYDDCAYDKYVSESISPLSYLLNPVQKKNTNLCHNDANKCRYNTKMARNATAYPWYTGKVVQREYDCGGGYLIDIESELRGQNRLATQCPHRKYQPHYPMKPVQKHMPPELCPYVNTGLQAPRKLNWSHLKGGSK